MGMGAYLEQDWQNIIFEMGDGYLWVSLLFCLHLKMNSLGLPWRAFGLRSVGQGGWTKVSRVCSGEDCG